MFPKQAGATLLELMLVVGLLAVGTVITMEEAQSDLEIQQSKVVGNTLFQYNNAARAWLSNNIGAGSPAITKTGTAWLKSSSCVGGQSAIAYLPCNFPDASAANPISFGSLGLTTTIVTTGAAPNQVTTLTTQSTPFIAGSQKRSDLSAVAAITAAAGQYDTRTPMPAATNGSFKSDPATAIITMTASNNGSNDAWLRTDGSNTMNNNLRFNPAVADTMRNIQGASRISSLLTEALYLGPLGGASSTAASRVIVDADQTIMGKMIVNNVKGGDGILLTNGNIRASGGSVFAGNSVQAAGTVIAGSDVTAGGNMIASNSVIAYNSVQAAGNMTAGGSVAAQGNVTAQNSVVAQGSVTAQGNVSAAGVALAQVFYDSNNTGYYLDPNNSSVMNSLNLLGSSNVNGRATFNEYVQLNGVAVKGTACAPNGLVGRAATGKMLSCDSGIWMDPAASGSCPYQANPGANFALGNEGSCTGIYYPTPPGQAVIGATRTIHDIWYTDYVQICGQDGAWRTVSSSKVGGCG